METVKDVLVAGSLRPSMPAPHPSSVPAPLAAPLTAAAALDQLVSEVAGTCGAVLASVDGFPLAQSRTMPADDPAHAALLAAALGIARQVVATVGGGNLRQMALDHDAGLLLVWPIGSQRVLAVLADADVDQRTLRHFVRANVRVFDHRPAAFDTASDAA
jgi:uncharacterized protein